jgi:hypothetical protein
MYSPTELDWLTHNKMLKCIFNGHTLSTWAKSMLDENHMENFNSSANGIFWLQIYVYSAIASW